MPFTKEERRARRTRERLRQALAQLLFEKELRGLENIWPQIKPAVSQL